MAEQGLIPLRSSRLRMAPPYAAERLREVQLRAVGSQPPLKVTPISRSGFPM